MKDKDCASHQIYPSRFIRGQISKNYVCGGPNQVNASKPGWKSRIGSIISNCDSSGVEGASCNPKFVADSSDYVRFRKLRATNKNYNDNKLA